MPYQPTARTRARQAETHRRILDAALALVAELGYREAQVASVAARAGVATGTVYRYFPSKDELFGEVFQLATRRELKRVTEAAQGGGSVHQRIARVVEVFSRWALQEPALASALIAESFDAVAGAERLAYRRGYQRVLKGLIAEAVAGELCEPVDPAPTASFVVGGLVESLMGSISSEAEGGDRDLLVKTLIATVERTIFGDLGRAEGPQQVQGPGVKGRETGSQAPRPRVKKPKEGEIKPL